MSSLQQTDAEAAAVAVAPRVTLADIEGAIAARFDLKGTSAAIVSQTVAPITSAIVRPSLDVLSICILVMQNGFVVVGKSAPASADNFNAELGRKFAYEDCIRQLWPLMGYALRDRLAAKAA